MWQRKTKPKEWKTVWITYCLNGSQCVRNMIAKDPTKHEKCTEKQQMQRRTKYSHIFSQTIFTFSPFNFNAFYSVDFGSDQMWQRQENQMQHNGQFITHEKRIHVFRYVYIVCLFWRWCEKYVIWLPKCFIHLSFIATYNERKICVVCVCRNDPNSNENNAINTCCFQT